MEIEGDEGQISASKAGSSGVWTGQGMGPDRQPSLLLDESYSAELFNLDVRAPILHEFDRAPIALAIGDGTLDMLLCIQVLTPFAEQAQPGVFIFG